MTNGTEAVQLMTTISYFCVCLRLVYPMLPVSLDCLFLIVPLVFSNVYLHNDISFAFLINLFKDFTRKKLDLSELLVIIINNILLGW